MYTGNNYLQSPPILFLLKPLEHQSKYSQLIDCCRMKRHGRFCTRKTKDSRWILMLGFVIPVLEVRIQSYDRHLFFYGVFLDIISILPPLLGRYSSMFPQHSVFTSTMALYILSAHVLVGFSRLEASVKVGTIIFIFVSPAFSSASLAHKQAFSECWFGQMNWLKEMSPEIASDQSNQQVQHHGWRHQRLYLWLLLQIYMENPTWCHWSLQCQIGLCIGNFEMQCLTEKDV